MVALVLAIASTSVPAGIPDRTEVTRELHEERLLALRTARAVEDARVAYIVDRYRRPAAEARAIVQAAERAGRQHGLPATLLLAIAETESSFNPRARSTYGARGLMQVVPRFHPDAVQAAGGPSRLYDATVSIEVGALVLAGYVARAGDLAPALAKYSGGARGYASKIRRRMEAFEAAAFLATRTLDWPAQAQAADPRSAIRS
jgi:soluble lytic murein transglycosylase-like protein